MLTNMEKNVLAQWMLSYDASLTSLKFDKPEDLETAEAIMIWNAGLILNHNGSVYSVLPYKQSKDFIMVLEWTKDDQHIKQSSWKPTWEELAQKAMTNYDDYDPLYDDPAVDNLLEKMNLI